MDTAEPNARTNPEAGDACARCGSFEVLELAGQFLCADCVALAGCGCAGHGEPEDDV